MQQESLTQQWLRQNVQPYVAAGRVYADTDGALARFPTIRPKTDVYTYDDGRTQLLLCLHGLLPIAFRGASYNIPIALWVPRDYPREPPIAYVVPTSDMLVKASRHVDPSGRCATDYHQQWTRKPEVSEKPRTKRLRRGEKLIAR
ncbi:UEV-domain-containing protein [Punctularia strigosozonata HHB-11173 SS5]|uniref:UEV-domain-containing protein n=1 Tax=Punctularia strigosozonata (strain HHB-11173) TaxID=741275 RepID=UPI000441819E|nr:UEV-domain-containing protein [Punctularia strigosozonata HHB-11173 SS5]EIN07404.1 UEV-domain-containing protein [Punctularia strigosozonata HHB-11173 SS5]